MNKDDVESSSPDCSFNVEEEKLTSLEAFTYINLDDDYESSCSIKDNTNLLLCSEEMQKDSIDTFENALFGNTSINLPPIPSIPAIIPPIPSIPHIVKPDTAEYHQKVDSFASLPPIPLPPAGIDFQTFRSSITMTKETKPVVMRSKCKVESCKFYGNDGYGGYCSECFMCITVMENAPPSSSKSTDDSIYFDMIQNTSTEKSIDKQLCNGNGCQFFGSPHCNGYCSHCFTIETRRVQMNEGCSNEGRDGDCKMCIICLQSPYNTVLLPCGHLYLCYQCASSIKKKAGNCPGCRTHINSFHRVYTPD